MPDSIFILCDTTHQLWQISQSVPAQFNICVSIDSHYGSLYDQECCFQSLEGEGVLILNHDNGRPSHTQWILTSLRSGPHLPDEETKYLLIEERIHPLLFLYSLDKINPVLAPTPGKSKPPGLVLYTNQKTLSSEVIMKSNTQSLLSSPRGWEESKISHPVLWPTQPLAQVFKPILMVVCIISSPTSPITVAMELYKSLKLLSSIVANKSNGREHNMTAKPLMGLCIYFVVSYFSITLWS